MINTNYKSFNSASSDFTKQEALNIPSKPILTSALPEEISTSNKGFILISRYASLLFIIVWLVGFLITFIRFIYKRLMLSRMLKNMVPVTESAWLKGFSKAWEILGRRKKPLLLTNSKIGPFTAYSKGVQVIGLPKLSDFWKEEKIDAVMRHEVAHLRRYDSELMLMAEFLTCFLWILPFSHLFLSKICIEREEACDLMVTESGINSKNYALCILDLSTNCNFTAMSGAQGVGGINIERRIKMILDVKKSSNKSRRFYTTGMLLIALSVVSVLLLPPLFTNEPESLNNTSDKTKEKVNLQIGAETKKTKILLGTLTANQDVLWVEKEFDRNVRPQLWPIKNGLGHISFYFGQHENPFNGLNYFHSGLDITTYQEGDPVIATSDGEIIKTGYEASGYGNYILIKNENIYTLYAHLKDWSVKEGQKVKAGDTIGRIGNTGISSGAHLHYGIYSPGPSDDFSTEELKFMGGCWIDPLTAIELKNKK